MIQSWKKWAWGSPYTVVILSNEHLTQSETGCSTKIESKNISIIAWTWKKWEIRNIYINKIFKKDRFINNQLTRLSNL